MVQWLGLCACIDGGLGSIPGQGTKIPKSMWYSQNKTNINKRKQREPMHHLHSYPNDNTLIILNFLVHENLSIYFGLLEISLGSVCICNIEFFHASVKLISNSFLMPLLIQLF